MRRIVVIGCPGVGKTAFAKKLAAETRLPLIHLDYYYHNDQFNFYEDKTAWREKVSELVAQQQWIIDGNYKSTFDIRFARADTIIFLDYSRGTALTRALIRRIKLHGKVREEMPANWTEKFTSDLFKFIWAYNKIERPKLHKMLRDERAKKQIIILKNSRQAERYLAELTAP